MRFDFALVSSFLLFAARPSFASGDPKSALPSSMTNSSQWVNTCDSASPGVGMASTSVGIQYAETCTDFAVTASMIMVDKNGDDTVVLSVIYNNCNGKLTRQVVRWSSNGYWKGDVKCTDAIRLTASIAFTEIDDNQQTNLAFTPQTSETGGVIFSVDGDIPPCGCMAVIFANTTIYYASGEPVPPENGYCTSEIKDEYGQNFTRTTSDGYSTVTVEIGGGM